jgi:PAS domain S-box-containing protein
MKRTVDVGLVRDLEVRAALNAFEERLISQRNALVSLTNRHLAGRDALPAMLAEILETSAATLGVDRASIWTYSQSRSTIECVDLYEIAGARHSSGFSLSESDYPSYFCALATADVVAADDARTDPRTREFAASYLEPLGIVSIIDAPIHANGVVAGVLCHEHIGGQRHWTSDEKSFVVAISNLVSLAMERHERSRAEATMALQVAALNAAADSMVITDREGTVLWANPAFTRLTGYSFLEAIGKNPRELLKSGVHDQAFYRQMWDTLLGGNVWRGELTNRRKDGTTYIEEQTITPVRSRGRITNFVSIKRDLTDRRLLESQFLQAQKMEIVGRLAGGIAHDFNNLLTVINGTAELVLSDLPADHPACTDLRRIQESGARAVGLTRQLLSFSRKEIARRELLDLGSVIAEFRSMLQRLIGEDIRLTVKAEEGLDLVLADPSQMEQVVLNLAVNARDAMPLGGSLTIEAANIELTPAFAASHAGVVPGPHVMLAVTDSGTGMSAETLARAFEPFFTTKEDGKGTGLGLATVYGVVAQSDGTVWVESELGRGSCFRVYLPRARAAEAGLPLPDAQPGSTDTLLLVEDDEIVRDLAARFLEAAGFKVLSVRDGMAARSLLATRKEVALVVTDAALMDLEDHDLPVVLTAAFTDSALTPGGSGDRSIHFIAKPYTAVGLVGKVRAVLGQYRARAGAA